MVGVANGARGINGTRTFTDATQVYGIEASFDRSLFLLDGDFKCSICERNDRHGHVKEAADYFDVGDRVRRRR